MSAPSAEITTLLKAWRQGDQKALDRLTPLVYDHLRRLARQYVRKERPDGRMNATALVHEAYVRLVDARAVDWQDRAHFFAVSAKIMRRILVDAARERGSLKRGGKAVHISLDDAPDVARTPGVDVVALDAALEALAALDVRKSQVVELRYFGGLSVDETAEALGVSAETVTRDWRMAKLWLVRELKAGAPQEPADRR